MAPETKRRSDGTASLQDHTASIGTLFLREGITPPQGNGGPQFRYRGTGVGAEPHGAALAPRGGF